MCRKAGSISGRFGRGASAGLTAERTEIVNRVAVIAPESRTARFNRILSLAVFDKLLYRNLYQFQPFYTSQYQYSDLIQRVLIYHRFSPTVDGYDVIVFIVDGF